MSANNININHEGPLLRLLDLAPYSKAERESFDNAAVRDVISRDPSLARIKHEYASSSGRVYPLFMAASLGASVDVISLLCDACPEALGDTDRYGRTPLHQAVEFSSSSSSSKADDRDGGVVRLLLERRAESAAARDHIGRTPLHCACAYGASEIVVRALLDVNPRAVFDSDNRGRLPLHVACAQGEEVSLSAVRLLIERYPSAIHKRNGKGATALELVEKGNASLEVLSSLTAVETMLKEEGISQDEARSLVSQLGSMSWRGGVSLLLDLKPHIVHTLDLDMGVVMPQLLFMVGRGDCKLETMFEVVKDMPGMFDAQAKTTSIKRK